MSSNDQRIEPLNAAELTWVETELANARKLVESFCEGESPQTLTPEILDKAYTAAYHAAPPADGNYANTIINAVGIAFGQYLVDTLEFQWCAVFDSHGQELAVVALPETGKVLVFPPNLVAKRWEAGSTDFLKDVALGIERSLNEARCTWGRLGESNTAPTGASTGLLTWFHRLFGRRP